MVIARTAKGKSFGKALKYVLDKEDAQMIYTNVPTALLDIEESLAGAIASQMRSTASLNPRVTKPVYHLSVSPAPGDDLKLADWINFSEDLIEELGFQECEVAVALHHDQTYPNGTPRPHAHFIINLVDHCGKRTSTSWDWRKTQSALRRLEKAYALEPVEPSWESYQRRDPPGQVQRIEREQAEVYDPNHPRTEPPQRSQRKQFQQAIAVAFEDSQTLEDIVDRLAVADIRTIHSEWGWAFEQDGVYLAGYQLGRAYTKAAIIEQLNAMVQPEYEQHQEGDAPHRQEISPQSDCPYSSFETIGAIFKAARQQSHQELTNTDSGEHSVAKELAMAGSELERFGIRTQREGEGLDGMTLSGAAISATGSVLKIGGVLIEALPRAASQPQQERLNKILDDLEAVDTRTEKLSQDIKNLYSEPTPSTNEAEVEWHSESQIPAETGEIETEVFFFPETEDFEETRLPDEFGEQATLETGKVEADNPLATGTEAIGKRVSKLEEKLEQFVSLDEKFKPIQIDRTASFDEQFTQIEKAIASLNERLDKLQESVKLIKDIHLEQSGITGDQIADILSNYSQARAFVYGLDPCEPIPTKTMGTMEVSDGGDRVLIKDEEYGVKFEAMKVEEVWQVTTNELSPAEVAKLRSLPTTPESYRLQADGKDLVAYFQRNVPEQFSSQEGGSIQWYDTQGEFSYDFTIEHQKNGQIVRGFDREKSEIFSATIRADGVIQTSKSEIPSKRIDQLLQQEQRELQQRRIQQHHLSKSQEQELAL